MWVCGGRSAKEGWDYGLRSAEHFDIQKLLWMPAAPMPVPRYLFSMVVMYGKLLACGGARGQGVDLNAVEQYDFVTRLWQTIAPLPTPRQSYSAAVAAGMLYICGGTSEWGQHAADLIFDSCLRFDP